jgi:hypothetical protein
MMNEQVDSDKNIQLDVAQITAWRKNGIPWKLIQKRLGIKSNNRNKLLRWKKAIGWQEPEKSTEGTGDELLDVVQVGHIDDASKASLLNVDQVTEWRANGVPWAMIQKMVGIKNSNRNKLTRWRRTVKFVEPFVERVESDLYEILKGFLIQHPTRGEMAAHDFLRSQGLEIKRKTLRGAIKQLKEELGQQVPGRNCSSSSVGTSAIAIAGNGAVVLNMNHNKAAAPRLNHMHMHVSNPIPFHPFPVDSSSSSSSNNHHHHVADSNHNIHHHMFMNAIGTAYHQQQPSAVASNNNNDPSMGSSGPLPGSHVV